MAFLGWILIIVANLGYFLIGTPFQATLVILGSAGALMVGAIWYELHKALQQDA